MFAAPTFDAAQPDAPSARVAFADLDLASPAGRQTLAHRLDGAVARVCADDSGSGTRFIDSRCRHDARARAAADLRQAGVPTL